jgi:hypothetical protein
MNFIIEPYLGTEYSPLLEVMNSMLTFGFVQDDLATKDRMYSAHLTRWAVWCEATVHAFCNVYDSQKSLTISWFHRPDNLGQAALGALLAEMLAYANTERKPVYSRVLGGTVLEDMLNKAGFSYQSKIADLCLDIFPNSLNKTTENLSLGLQTSSLEECLKSPELVRQLYHLQENLRVSLPLFERALSSMARLSHQASRVVLEANRAIGYSLVLENEQNQYKLRKVVAKPENYLSTVSVLAPILIDQATKEYHDKVWAVSEGMQEVFWLDKLGFKKVYSWIKMMRPYRQIN